MTCHPRRLHSARDDVRGDLLLRGLIEREVEFTLNWSFASALGSILLVLTLAAFVVYYRLMRLERLFEGLG